MFPSNYFPAGYFTGQYWPPGSVTITPERVGGLPNRGFTSFLKRRHEVKGTYEIYKELRKAREKVEEIPEKPKLKAREIKKRHKALEAAEVEVRERLAFARQEIGEKPMPDEALAEFVGAIRFSEDLGDVPGEDMEQILLIIMIDEWTDD